LQAAKKVLVISVKINNDNDMLSYFCDLYKVGVLFKREEVHNSLLKGRISEIRDNLIIFEPP
jgi:hypothetical protein